MDNAWHYPCQTEGILSWIDHADHLCWQELSSGKQQHHLFNEHATLKPLICQRRWFTDFCCGFSLCPVNLQRPTPCALTHTSIQRTMNTLSCLGIVCTVYSIHICQVGSFCVTLYWSEIVWISFRDIVIHKGLTHSYCSGTWREPVSVSNNTVLYISPHTVGVLVVWSRQWQPAALERESWG